MLWSGILVWVCCMKLRGHGEAVLFFALSIPFSAMAAVPQLGKIDASSVKDNGNAAVRSSLAAVLS